MIDVLFTAALAIAGTAPAFAAETHQFDVPSEDASTAIRAFASQAHVQILVAGENVQEKHFHSVTGEYSTEQGLQLLLADSGLSPQYVGDRSIALVKASDAYLPSQGNAKEGKRSSSEEFRVAQVDQGAVRPQAVDGQTLGKKEEGLAEIVVTAQKREERLLSVAAPVTALTSADLMRAGATRLDDYAAKVPGLSLISGRDGETQIIMRGISTGFNGSSTTSVYVDDSPFGSSTAFAIGGFTALDLDPASLQRIEVLRGPQGTLYGASSLGGLVKYVTAPPSLTEFSGRVAIDGSAVDSGGQGYGVRAAVSGPIVADTLGVSLSAFYRRDPGYIDNPQLGQKNANDAHVDGGRLAVLWRPADNLSIEVSALLHDSTTTTSSEVDLNSVLKPIGPGLTHIRYIDEPFDVRSRLYNAVVDYDLAWANLKSITSYQRQHVIYDQDYSDAYGPLLGGIVGATNPGAIAYQSVTQSKATEEVRLQSPGSSQLEWQGGLFFTHESSEFPQVLDTFDRSTHELIPSVTLYDVDLISRYTEYAAFGDLTYHFTSDFSVLAGVRYSENRQRYMEPMAGLLTGGSSVINGTSSDNSVTYLVSPKYQLNSDAIVYARVASGYRPGGPNAVTTAQVAIGVPESFKPDSLTNYEIGYKTSLFSNAVTLELSAFDIEWKDIQLLETFQGIGTVGNGSTARSRGFEAASTWTPIRGVKLAANLAYTDAHLTNDAPGVNGKKGDELPEVPRFAGNISADYDFPLTASIGGFAGATYQYQGARKSEFVSFSPADYQRPILPKYSTADLRIGMNRRGLEIEAYVKNVGDSFGIYRLRSLAIDGLSAPRTASVIQPRTFGISISQKF